MACRRSWWSWCTLERSGVLAKVRGIEAVQATRRIDELQPELRSSLYIYRVYFLAVSGQFHDLVKRTKIDYVNAEHPPEERLVAPQPVGDAQRARRRLAGLVRGTGSGRAKCT